MGPKTDIVGTENNNFLKKLLLDKAITLHIPSNTIENIFGTLGIF